MHPDYRALVASHMAAFREKGVGFPRREMKLLRLNGSPVDVDVIVMPVTFEGRPARQVIIHDITGRKRADASLRASEQRYRSLFEDSPISLWEEDLSGVKAHLDSLQRLGVKDYRTYFENHPDDVARCAALVKVTDVNKATLTLYRAGDRQAFLNGLGVVFRAESFAAFREGLVAIAEGKTVFEIESVDQTLTGEKKHIALKWSVAPGCEGTLAKVLVSIVDITGRKVAQAALQESERFALAIADTAPIAMYIHDVAHDRIVWTNEVYRETVGPLFGGDLATLSQERFMTLVHPDDRAGLRAGLEALRKDPGTLWQDVELRMQLPDGKWRWYLDRATAFRRTDSGELLELIAFMLDITDQRQAQQMLEQRETELLHVSRLSTLGEMASGIAHELNQPLSAILSYADACLRLMQCATPDIQRVANNLQQIVSQGERAGEIIRRVRAFATRHQLHLTSVDLNGVVANVVTMVRWELANKAIQLRVELAESLPLIIADAIQMEQVVLNLTRNAIEAMEHWPERLLTLRTMVVGATQVRVDVCDTGVGLPADGVERMFEPFFSTKAGGLGIGLSISRSIVQMHYGILEARPNTNRGSIFSMTLPIHRLPDASMPLFSESRPEGEGGQDTIR